MTTEPILLRRLRRTADAVVVYGHRGARGAMPENTMAGFRYLRAIGISAFELDVQNAAGGVPVITHDPVLPGYVARDTCGRWLEVPGPKVMDTPYPVLARYDLGALMPGTGLQRSYPDQARLAGAHMPSLDELCAWAAGEPDLILNAEIKSFAHRNDLGDPPEELAASVLKVFEAHGLLSRAFVSSFDWSVLSACRRIAPEVVRGYLSQVGHPAPPMQSNLQSGSVWLDGHQLEDFDNSVPRMVSELGGHVWCPQYNEVTEQDVQLAHDLGLVVNVWTVNSIDDLRCMIDMGVDGLITDYPARAQNVLADMHLNWIAA